MSAAIPHSARGEPFAFAQDRPVEPRIGARLHALRQAQGERSAENPRPAVQFALHSTQPVTNRPETLRFAGYAALFGKRDAGRDVIRKGAFANSLATRRDPLPLFWQHRPDLRIGWIETVAEDDRGLRVIATIDNPDGGAGLALRQGKVTGLSFGYRTLRSRVTAEGRELLDLDLIEISLVANPMQDGARVHLVA